MSGLREKIGRKLGQIDRRVIYFALIPFVVIPLLAPLGLKINISPEVKTIYDYIERLTPDDCVFISADYDPQVDAELTPMFEAIVRHCFKRNVKVLVANIFSIEGMALVEPRMRTLAEEYQKIYGVDYVFLGFRQGYEMLILGMGDDINRTWEVDYYGSKLEDLPMMHSMKNYKDIDLVVDLSGSGVYVYWIQFGYIKFNVKVAAGMTAVMAPDAYPQLQAGQLIGLIGGLRGAAEYEQLVGHKGFASAGMEAQSWTHILIVLLILLGNFAYLLARK